MINITSSRDGINLTLEGNLFDLSVEMLAAVRAFLRDVIANTSPEVGGEALQLFYEAVNSPHFLSDDTDLDEIVAN